MSKRNAQCQYATYYVEPLSRSSPNDGNLDNHTNLAVARFLEQQAVVSECYSLMCADGKLHSVWKISADQYVFLKKNASKAILCFRTWVKLIEGEKPSLLETIEGSTVIPAIPATVKGIGNDIAFRDRLSRLREYLKQKNSGLEALICLHQTKSKES
jgi:hypothetical protein